MSKNIMYLSISKPILSDQKTNSLIFTKIYSVQELNDYKVYVPFYSMYCTANVFIDGPAILFYIHQE